MAPDLVLLFSRPANLNKVWVFGLTFFHDLRAASMKPTPGWWVEGGGNITVEQNPFTLDRGVRNRVR